MNKSNQRVKIARAYYENGRKFAQLIFIDNELVETNYFKKEGDQVIPCLPPENEKDFIVPIDLDNFGNSNKLEIIDTETGEVVNIMDKLEELSVIDGIKLMIKPSDKDGWKKTIEPIGKFSIEEKEKIKKSMFPTQKEDGSSSSSLVYMEQVSKAIEDILSEQKAVIPHSFYKGIDSKEGFGIERFVLDRVYYLPKLLEDTNLTFVSGTTYLISSEQKDSSGNSIKLEHRFQATNDEEAKKLYEKISTRLAGVQQKIWLACWSLGNKLKKFTYTCQLTDLMHLTYPERNGYFAVSDKIEFYEHLKSLEQTRFVFSKPYKKRGQKKDLRISYTIPLLSIPVQLGEENRYPQDITLSIRTFDPDPIHEKIYHVGAEIKHKTLELHADDAQLATWVQTRKSQRQKEDSIEIDLNFLFSLSGLERTAQSNKTHAKKLLTNKLQRLIDKGIILSFPTKLENIVVIKVR